MKVCVPWILPKKIIQYLFGFPIFSLTLVKDRKINLNCVIVRPQPDGCHQFIGSFVEFLQFSVDNAKVISRLIIVRQKLDRFFKMFNCLVIHSQFHIDDPHERIGGIAAGVFLDRIGPESIAIFPYRILPNSHQGVPDQQEEKNGHREQFKEALRKYSVSVAVESIKKNPQLKECFSLPREASQRKTSKRRSS